MDFKKAMKCLGRRVTEIPHGSNPGTPVFFAFSKYSELTRLSKTEKRDFARPPLEGGNSAKPKPRFSGFPPILETSLVVYKGKSVICWIFTHVGYFLSYLQKDIVNYMNFTHFEDFLSDLQKGMLHFQNIRPFFENILSDLQHWDIPICWALKKSGDCKDFLL